MEVKHHHGPLVGGQASHGGVDVGPVAGPRVGGRGGFGPAHLGIQTEHASEPRPPAQANGLADDDSIEPRSKTLVITKGRPPAPGLLEPSLDGIGRVGPVAADQVREPDQAIVMLGDERAERTINGNRRRRPAWILIQLGGEAGVRHLARIEPSEWRVGFSRSENRTAGEP